MTRWTSLFSGRSREAVDASSRAKLPHWLARAEVEPREPFVRRRAGEELMRRGDIGGAISHWIEAADLYVAGGQPLKALAVLGLALRADATNESVRSRIAAFALDRSDPGGGGGTNDAVTGGIGAAGRPRVPLYSDLPAADLIDLARRLDARKFVAGEILLREGEVADGFSILVEGVVRILGRNGRRAARIGQLGPGDFFGVTSLLAGITSVATLAAEIPGEILVLPRAALQSLLGERPQLREALDAFQRAAAGEGPEAAVARFRAPR